MRKRILTTLLSTLLLSVLLPSISFAVSTGTDEISGVVTSSGSVAVGAQVTVDCDNNVKTTTTDSTGTYLVQYKAPQCPNEALAKVTANYGGVSGNNSGEVKGENLILAETLNKTAAPELGLVMGATAAVLGGVGYFSLRRR